MGKLERIKDVDYVVMDKTGTLTQGTFGVSGIVPIGKLSKDEIIQIAASLESHSSHPIATSIVKFAQQKQLPLHTPQQFQNISGKGIIATLKKQRYLIGNQALMENHGLWDATTDTLTTQFSQEDKTIVYLATDKQILGVILLEDQLKPESIKTINNLHRLGIKVAMLTGDNETTADAVAKKLKLDTYFANVLPENKYTRIKSLQEKGHVVMMVGDGVNDAPALTQADVGVPSELALMLLSKPVMSFSLVAILKILSASSFLDVKLTAKWLRT